MPILSPQIDLASALADTLKAVQFRLHGYIHDPKFHALDQAKILDVCKDTCCATLPNFPREYSVCGDICCHYYYHMWQVEPYYQ